MENLLFFANTQASGSEPNSIIFILVGFCTVLFALGGLALMTFSIGYVISKVNHQQAPSAVPTMPVQALPTEPFPLNGELSRREIAVVAAAIYALVKDPHRIVSIRPSSTHWSKEGRRSHFGSHQLR